MHKIHQKRAAKSHLQLTQKVLRLTAVIQMTGYCYGSIYLKVAKGTFPPPIDLGGRTLGWFEADIVNWINSRIAASRNASIAKGGDHE